MKRINALIVTKGHDFEREPFFEMLDAVATAQSETFIEWTHVEHPAAEAVLNPVGAAPFDVIAFYDMPGVVFTRSNPPFAHVDPSETFKRGLLALFDEGKPMIFMHHAIASWPTWPEFAELLGARFHFLPGNFNGQDYPGSGYRFRVDQTITIEDTSHPITQGLGETFDYRDEVYLFPVKEEDVTPLLRSNFEFEADNFRYGGIGFKQHPTGSNLVAWTKQARNSEIVYLQFGHDRIAYESPRFRTLLGNALSWATDKAALVHKRKVTERTT